MFIRDYDERHYDEYERDYCFDGDDYPNEQEEQDFRYGSFE